jgi:hypothetical protein
MPRSELSRSRSLEMDGSSDWRPVRTLSEEEALSLLRSL